jgi:hypothetical protein
MKISMTSKRKIDANRRNSLKSCGPRSAAGKSVASRNAMRHGLAALTHRKTAPSAEIEQFARALCGNDSDPAIYAQAVKIVENEMLLQAIRKQQAAAVERLRERIAVPFASKDNSLVAAKLRSLESRQAEREISERFPDLITKYKDKVSALMEQDVPVWANSYDAIMAWFTGGTMSEADTLPCILDELVSESKPVDNQILELARQQIEAGQRDEHEAFQAAICDLVRLDRYESRAWSRQKRVILEFIRIKTTGRTSAVEERAS